MKEYFKTVSISYKYFLNLQVDLGFIEFWWGVLGGVLFSARMKFDEYAKLSLTLR